MMQFFAGKRNNIFMTCSFDHQCLVQQELKKLHFLVIPRNVPIPLAKFVPIFALLIQAKRGSSALGLTVFQPGMERQILVDLYHPFIQHQKNSNGFGAAVENELLLVSTKHAICGQAGSSAGIFQRLQQQENLLCAQDVTETVIHFLVLLWK